MLRVSLWVQGAKACINPYYYPAEKRTMDYMHAHVTWTIDSKPFVTEVVTKCASGGGLDCSSDEAALNTALWDAGATKQLCFIDPFSWFAETWENGGSDFEGLNTKGATVGYMYLHGSKNPESMVEFLGRIRKMQGKPWIHDAEGWKTSPKGLVRNDTCLI